MNLFLVNTAFAAGGNVTLKSLMSKIIQLIVNPLIILMFALALAYFTFGVVVFLANKDDETKRTAGKQHMIWGVVGMFIMISVFGIMRLIVNSLGITNLPTSDFF